jgi:hypothetical protein
MAHTGYKGQQTDELQDPIQCYNLYEPVPGDHGAHGRFDDRARNSSPQLWTDLHRDSLAAFALLGRTIDPFFPWTKRGRKTAPTSSVGSQGDSRVAAGFSSGYESFSPRFLDCHS